MTKNSEQLVESADREHSEVHEPLDVDSQDDEGDTIMHDDCEEKHYQPSDKSEEPEIS